MSCGTSLRYVCVCSLVLIVILDDLVLVGDCMNVMVFECCVDVL